MSFLASLALLPLVPLSAAAACALGVEDGEMLLTRGPVQLAWRVAGEAEGSASSAPQGGTPRGQIGVSRLFALALRVCPADARLLRVDASMPAHRHGMNYRPSLVALDGGRWRAEGLMFHMAGGWEVQFVVQSTHGPMTLRQTIELP